MGGILNSSHIPFGPKLIFSSPKLEVFIQSRKCSTWYLKCKQRPKFIYYCPKPQVCLAKPVAKTKKYNFPKPHFICPKLQVSKKIEETLDIVLQAVASLSLGQSLDTFVQCRSRRDIKIQKLLLLIIIICTQLHMVHEISENIRTTQGNSFISLANLQMCKT